jgi:hypothetical protein
MQNGPRVGRLKSTAGAVLVLMPGKPPHTVPACVKLRFDFGRCLSGTRQFDGTQLAANRLHTPAYLSWSQTMQRRRFKPSLALEERLAEESKRLGEQADHVPIGHEREALLKEQAWPTRLATSPKGSRRPGCNHPRRKAATVQAFFATFRMPSRSCTTATNPLLSSQRSPSASCLRSFLAWPTGSFRARLKASATCRLIGDSAVSNCC